MTDKHETTKLTEVEHWEKVSRLIQTSVLFGALTFLSLLLFFPLVAGGSAAGLMLAAIIALQVFVLAKVGSTIINHIVKAKIASIRGGKV